MDSLAYSSLPASFVFVSSKETRKNAPGCHLASSILSALDWADFDVAVLYGFIVDPGPYLIENRCLGSFETFALTVKKMYLEVFDLVDNLSVPRVVHSFKADDVGSGWTHVCIGQLSSLRRVWNLLARYKPFGSLRSR